MQRELPIWIYSNPSSNTTLIGFQLVNQLPAALLLTGVQGVVRETLKIDFKTMN